MRSFFLFGNFFRYEKNFSTKKIHLKKNKKNSHQKTLKNSDQIKCLFSFSTNFFFSCLNSLIQVKIETPFLLGTFYFCLEIFLRKKKNSHQKKFLIIKKKILVKKIVLLFYENFFSGLKFF